MTDIKQKILKASVLHIRSYGFSEKAIIEGCHFLDLSPASKGLIPNNELSLVHHVLDQGYQSAFDTIRSRPAQSPAGLDTSAISLGVSEYIMSLAQYAEFWDEAMLILARPSNVMSSLSMLYSFSGGLHREAGGSDGSVPAFSMGRV